jgi:hypothetical protein
VTLEVAGAVFNHGVEIEESTETIVSLNNIHEEVFVDQY